MRKDSLVSFQQEANGLIAQLPRLPRERQQQVIDRIAHMVAVSIVGQIGVQVNTAMYQAEAANAFQMLGSYHLLSQLEQYLPPEMQGAFAQSFANALDSNRAIREQVERHILSDIRSIQAHPEPAAQQRAGDWEFLKVWKLFTEEE